MRHYGVHVLSGLARIVAGVSLGVLGMLPSARASFLYPPIPSEPILSATLTVNIGGLYGNRFLFGEEENSAVLLAPGFLPLDLSSALFGTSSFPDPPLVNLANDETEIIGAAIPPWFFPALRGGVIGYSFLFSDTGDGIFALDYIDLRIVTPSGAIDSFLGPATCFGAGSLPCPASTSGAVDVSNLPPNATGFDEPIANISLISEPPASSSVPEPSSTTLLLIGAGLLLVSRKRRRMGLLGVIAFVLIQLPAHALTKEQALRVLGDQVLKPSTSGAAIAVRMLPRPLFSGEVRPNTGGDPVIEVFQVGAGRPQWFAMVDLEPCAYFQHDVLYVFIDDSTGAVSVFPASDWPAIDGTSLGQDPLPGEHPILIFPILPKPNSVQATSPGPGPVADYGDAPDGDPAYVQPEVLGRFPTRYTTTNSSFGPGAHALVTGLEMLGRAVSMERDAQDPFDPDGLPNRADGDSDERMFVVWDSNTNPAKANLLYDVTIASGAPDMDRYVNFLIDFDRNGAWGGSANGKEWAVVNQVVRVAPGTTATQVSPAFDWGGARSMPTQAWMRAALSRTPINPAPYGPAGWDGSGAFIFGEIEDSEIYLGFCQPDLTYAEALANPAYARFNPRPLPQNPDRLPLPAVDPPAPSPSTNSPLHF
jgi:hypothetical protein